MGREMATPQFVEGLHNHLSATSFWEYLAAKDLLPEEIGSHTGVRSRSDDHYISIAYNSAYRTWCSLEI